MNVRLACLLVTAVAVGSVVAGCVSSKPVASLFVRGDALFVSFEGCGTGPLDSFGLRYWDSDASRNQGNPAKHADLIDSSHADERADLTFEVPPDSTGATVYEISYSGGHTTGDLLFNAETPIPTYPDAMTAAGGQYDSVSRAASLSC